MGKTDSCPGVTQPFDPSTATVFSEVFDNSYSEGNGSQPCGAWSYTAAPTAGASYDTRYYSSFVSGSPTSYTFYRYKAYYQDPAGGGIQVLAYGDFFSPTMAILAGTEAAASVTQDGTDPICPVAARSGSVNHFGLATSPATFADQLKLYINGAWTPWTSSAVATSYYTSPDTSPAYLLGPASNPVSNATQFNAWGAY